MAEPSGVIPAQVTPFTEDGLAVDYDAIPPHLDYMAGRGADGVLVLGTNGEFSSLSMEEKKQVLDAVMENKGDLSVLCGSHSASLTDTIELSRYAEDRGADALLITTPFYFKDVPHEGLLRYYSAVFESVDIPIFLYNVPSFTAVEVTDELVGSLSKYANLVGVKDTSGDLERTVAYCQRFPNLKIFVGSDSLIAPALKAGCVGSISATANVFPDLLKAVFDAHEQGGDPDEPQEKVSAVREVMGRYPFAACTKYALYLMGLKETFVRPPLVNLSPEQKKSLEEDLRALGLL